MHIVIWTERLRVRERWRKIAAAKKCIVATRRTQAKANDVTRPCVLGSRRVEESSKASSSPNARAIFMHTSASTNCLAHRDSLSVWRHVLGASLEAANVFSWIWREKTSSILPLNFQCNVIWIFYISFPLIHDKSIFADVNNLQEIIV